jgi:hypothetical protein
MGLTLGEGIKWGEQINLTRGARSRFFLKSSSSASVKIMYITNDNQHEKCLLIIQTYSAQ